MLKKYDISYDGGSMNKKFLIDLLFILFLFLLFFASIITRDLYNLDEIWNFNFARNVANGLIPYKDFNMVITPFYPFLGALFLIIFGKSLLVYHIFNALICTGIFYFMKITLNKSYYIVYSILLLVSLPNYSLFSILLLYIILYLEDNKKNDFLIGIFIGLTFLTKQNIGIMFILPSILTKKFKQIKNRTIGFIIPNIIFFLYLIIILIIFY